MLMPVGNFIKQISELQLPISLIFLMKLNVLSSIYT